MSYTGQEKVGVAERRIQAILRTGWAYPKAGKDKVYDRANGAKSIAQLILTVPKSLNYGATVYATHAKKAKW